MTDKKYLEVVSIQDELPQPFDGTVAFVPGQGFQGAEYRGNGKWFGLITRGPIEPTHWLKPFDSLDALMRHQYDQDLRQWTKDNPADSSKVAQQAELASRPDDGCTCYRDGATCRSCYEKVLRERG